MRQYADKGYMQPTTVSSTSDDQYVILHFKIFKSDDTSKLKIRVVLDASSKCANSRSRNDELFTGPKLQNDIQTILLRFRLHPIVFTCNIQQMYRQILIQPSDRNVQLIRWRFNTELPIQTYQLNTVTYGVFSVPFLAIRVLHKLAEDYKETFSLASEVVFNNFYVDDVQGRGESIDQCIKLKDELIALLNKAGMKLHK